jgi:hypothetical protein
MGFAPGDGETRQDGTAQSHESADPAGSRGHSDRDVVPEKVRHRADTGDPRVDDVLSRLDDLAELPVAEHPAVFEYVHERLAEALGDLEVRDLVQPGQTPGAPGDHDRGSPGGHGSGGHGAGEHGAGEHGAGEQGQGRSGGHGPERSGGPGRGNSGR